MIALGPLLAAGTTAAEVTRWKWLSAPPAWVSFLVVLVAALFAALVYLREHSPAGRGRRLFLALLRAGAIVAVWALLGELVEVTTRQEVRPGWVAVMVDESVSMTLKDRFADRSRVEGLARATGLPEERVEDQARLDLVKRALAKDGWDVVRRLAEKNRVKVYTFAGRPLPAGEVGEQEQAEGPNATSTSTSTSTKPQQPALERIAALEATGPETAIGDCLNKVMGELRGQRLAGIVLVTDGRSNSGILPPLKVARTLKEREIPLFTVGAGNPDEPRDIALSDLQAAEVVIAGDVLPVKASVKSQGFEGEEGGVDLIVRLDDEVVRTEPIQLQGGGARQDVAVRVKPDKPGEYTLTVEIAPRPGELIQDNNRLSQRLRVIDKRIKVLYVDWRPRYEFRFLRWALIRDRNMEAHTFLIDADPAFPQDCSPGLQPLTQVPATREELRQYHVVVLGDLDPNDPQMGEERMKLIREFVEDQGGGLLVIAGENHMPRAYAGTPLEPLLPVVIDTADDDLPGSSRPIVEDFRPRLTLDGRRHPILQLENDPEQNLALWESRGPFGQGLPGFFWFYRPKEKRRTAEVLAAHPEAQTSKGEPVPIFTIQPAGAGTVFFAATDDVWRWRAGVADRYTYRLWGQAIRYLSTGKLLKSRRFGISTDKGVYDLGEKVVVSAEVHDRQMKPLTEEAWTVYIEGPEGQVEDVELAKRPESPGRYEGAKVPARVGTYKVWITDSASPRKPEATDEVVSKVFQVQVPILEKADPKMDEDLLRKMAMAAGTGGEYFPLAEIDRLPGTVRPIRDVSEVLKSERTLWDRWWVLCALVGLLGGEWFLRKWWKML